MNSKELKKLDERYVCNTYGRYPLAISRGKGCKLYDPEGKEYTDLLAGIAVINLGHGHPEIFEAIKEQYEKLVHVSNLFYQEPYALLAKKLTATCGAGKAFFCNSGAEANEAAIKLARRYMRCVAGRDAGGIITLENSFHGRTLATITATGQAGFQEHFQPLPEGFTWVPPEDLEAMEAVISNNTAAVLLEVVQGEGGVLPLSQEFLLGVERLCKKHNLLFMVDEVQTGLCRTGRFWAHQHYGLSPDIITAAKPLANGLPMGVMLATDEAAKGFAPGSHATTFGGGALVSAVACKVMDIMLRDKLDTQAAARGQYALEAFTKLQKKYPSLITEVRGLGLMLGIELSCGEENAKNIWHELLKHGFILNLAKAKVLRLLPPLVITENEIDTFAKALDTILAAMDTKV